MSARKRLPAVLVLGLLALPAAAPAASSPAPGTSSFNGRWIVVFKPSVQSVDSAISRRERRDGFRSVLRYRSAVKGFAARLSASQRASLRADPNVASVAPDTPVQAADSPLASGEPVPQPGVRRIGSASTTTASDPSGVAVAEIDTGIDLTHPDLNAVAGRNCVGSGAPQDDNGHGSHVAGIIGARNNGAGVVGVAPGTRLYAVKVLDSGGSGSTSQVICGLDWVSANAASLGIKVVNMSLSGNGSSASCGNTQDPEQLATCRVVAAGVTVVVAAGNSTKAFDASSLFSGVSVPAIYPEVLTVTAMSDTDGVGGALGPVPSCRTGESDDNKASFSNWAGSSAAIAHTIAGPGVCVRSTWMSGGYNTISGTSMASPHVAGAVALCLSEGGVPGACAGMTPAQIIQKMRSDAQARTQALSSYGFTGDPVRPISGRYYGYLVTAGTAGSGPPPPPAPPTVTTGSASSITSTSATVSGTVNPQGQATTYQFQYGPGTGSTYPSSTPAASAGSGTSGVPVSAPLSGLDPSSPYHFRLVATNATDTTFGADQTFSTTATPPPTTTVTENPSAVTVDSGSVRSGSVSSLTAADSAYLEVNGAFSFSPFGVASSWYGRFLSVPTSLSNLKVTYQGANSASCSQTVAIQRVSDSAWVALDTRTVGTSDVLLANLVPAGAASAYVTSGGELRVRVRCTTSSFSLFGRGNLMRIAYDT